MLVSTISSIAAACSLDQAQERAVGILSKLIFQGSKNGQDLFHLQLLRQFKVCPFHLLTLQTQPQWPSLLTQTFGRKAAARRTDQVPRFQSSNPIVGQVQFTHPLCLRTTEETAQRISSTASNAVSLQT